MTNSKQSSVEWLIDRIKNQHLYPFVPLDELEKQAKAMYKDEMEAFIIKQSAEESTLNASAFAIGYSSGYKRALDLVKWKIDNELNKDNEP